MSEDRRQKLKKTPNIKLQEIVTIMKHVFLVTICTQGQQHSCLTIDAHVR